jgi:type VI secretion system protein ImpC
MQLNFGMIGPTAVERQIAANAPFRLAVLGDFSAAANRGRLETGDDLGCRKPLRVDIDNIDKVMSRLNIKLTLPLADQGAVELGIGSMDDLHPDQIYEKASIFSSLSDLRQRLSSKGFASTAKEIAAWGNAASVPSSTPAPSRRPRGATVPRAGKLSDFAELIGQPSAPPSVADIVVEDLLKAVVRPHIQTNNPQQASLLASLDAALAATMRKVLHHPDFQALESLWRSIDFLIRRVETSTQLQIVLYDVSAEEFAADLSQTDSLEETGLYKLLVEQPSIDANQGALSAVVGAYVFDQTPPQAELLARMAKLAAIANAPFISSVNPGFLDTQPEEVHPLIKEAWGALSALDQSRFVALVTPRHLIRQPYGERTDTISAFDFEEFTPHSGLKGMLWGNPAIIGGMMLAQTFSKQGGRMQLGSILAADNIPYYVYVDEEGDTAALPCTERLMTERVAARVKTERFIPLLSIKGRPEIRLGGMTSLSGAPLAGRWPVPRADAGVPAPKPAKVKAAEKAPAPVEQVAASSEEEEASPSAEAEDAEATEAAEHDVPEGEGAEPSGDPELDALLKSLEEPKEEGETKPPAEEEGEMDPELASLLKQL